MAEKDILGNKTAKPTDTVTTAMDSRLRGNDR